MDFSGRLCVVTMSTGQVLMATSAHLDKEGVTLNGPKICEILPPKPPEKEGDAPSAEVVFSEITTRFIPSSRFVFLDTYAVASLQDNLRTVYQKLTGITLA